MYIDFNNNNVFVYLCLYPPFSVYIYLTSTTGQGKYIHSTYAYTCKCMNIYIYTLCVYTIQFRVCNRPNKRVVLINKCYSWNGKHTAKKKWKIVGGEIFILKA